MTSKLLFIEVRMAPGRVAWGAVTSVATYTVEHVPGSGFAATCAAYDQQAVKPSVKTTVCTGQPLARAFLLCEADYEKRIAALPAD